MLTGRQDARTDEWVQIAPESARPATLTPEQPVKAPGQGGDIFLARGEAGRDRGFERELRPGYVDEGGYQLVAGWVGNGSPFQWLGGRIVRVFTEDKPTQEPVLPRRIKPEDVQVGMVVERRKGDAAVRDRVQRIDGDLIMGVIGAYLWMPGYEVIDWTLSGWSRTHPLPWTRTLPPSRRSSRHTAARPSARPTPCSVRRCWTICALRVST